MNTNNGKAKCWISITQAGSFQSQRLLSFLLCIGLNKTLVTWKWVSGPLNLVFTVLHCNIVTVGVGGVYWNLVVHVSNLHPEDIFRTTEPYVTKLGMMMHHILECWSCETVGLLFSRLRSHSQCWDKSMPFFTRAIPKGLTNQGYVCMFYVYVMCLFRIVFNWCKIWTCEKSRGDPVRLTGL